jgi:hypothetical protein
VISFNFSRSSLGICVIFSIFVIYFGCAIIPPSFKNVSIIKLTKV